MQGDFWRDWRSWAGVGGIFTILGLAHAAAFRLGDVVAPGSGAWWRAVGVTLPFWWAKALLLPAVLWAARRFPIGPGRLLAPLLVHAPLSLLYALGHITLGAALGDAMAGGSGSGAMLGQLGPLYAMYGVIGTVYYWAFLGTILAFDYHREVLAKEQARSRLELRATRLEGSLTRARLDALRMQLDPHFLFNALNSVSVLAQKGRTEKVVRMLARLGELLRATLDRTEAELPLAEELDMLEAYLAIETVRFEDRLEAAFDIDPSIREAVVPTLILQPLVENAIRHGICEARRPVRIQIGARAVGGRLELRIRDSGRGFPQGLEERLGLGLANVRERLRELYGADHDLVLSSPGSGACVTIRIPLRRDGGASRRAGGAG